MQAAQNMCSHVAGVPISCCRKVSKQMGHFSSRSLLLMSELKPSSGSAGVGWILSTALGVPSGSSSSEDSTFFRLPFLVGR